MVGLTRNHFIFLGGRKKLRTLGEKEKGSTISLWRSKTKDGSTSGKKTPLDSRNRMGLTFLEGMASSVVGAVSGVSKRLGVTPIGWGFGGDLQGGGSNFAGRRFSPFKKI